MAEVERAAEADEEWTCGKGLAEHAEVPAKMAGYLEGLAENLDAHIPTIDATDAEGRAEREAYVGLAKEFAAVASRLRGAAERMRGYRDLPAAGHHEEALADPALLEAFGRLLELEGELEATLRGAVARDRELFRQLEEDS